METTKLKSLTPAGLAQSLLRLPQPFRPLKPERVQEYLKSMPGWRLMPGDSAIGRLREFADPGAAAAYASFVAELAGRQGHAFTIERVGRRIAVTLYQSARQGLAGGVTMAVLETARALG